MTLWELFPVILSLEGTFLEVFDFRVSFWQKCFRIVILGYLKISLSSTVFIAKFNLSSEQEGKWHSFFHEAVSFIQKWLGSHQRVIIKAAALKEIMMFGSLSLD